MADNEQPIEWYLARDGQRHGPISYLEMRTLVQLGHLRPTDLVWRYGFANWEAAANAFPAQPPQPQSQQPVPSPASAPAREAELSQPNNTGQPQAQSQPQAKPPSATVPGSQQQQPQQPKPARPTPATGASAPVAQGSGGAAPRPVTPQATPQPVRTGPTGPTQAATGQPGRQKPPMQAAGGAHPRAAMQGPQGAGPGTALAPGQGPARPAAGASRPSPDQEQDPLRHRRVAVDPQTRRASGYGEVPQTAQPTGTASAGYGAPSPASRTGPGAAAPAHGGPAPAGDTARPRGAPLPGGPGSASPYAPQVQVPREDVPHDLDEDPIVEPRRRGKTWLLVLLVAVLSVGLGALYALYKTGRLNLGALSALSSTQTPGQPAAALKASYKVSPLQGYAATPAEVDGNFQKSGLWQIIKANFPDDYTEFTTSVAKLKAEGQDDRAISTQLTRKLVEMRRKHAADALAARPERLRAVAQSFVDNLGSLSRVSTEACYRFISGGETDPMMIELMRTSENTGPMQALFAAIFEAIVDGRANKAKIPAAERKDYDLLAAQLSVRGWSPADLALFDDARALSRAPPQKVCQMVQDWFAAQLAIKDGSVQTRLFGATLKPLVGD